METSNYNRNTYSSRKMDSLKELFFMKKKEIINSPIKEIKQNESFI